MCPVTPKALHIMASIDIFVLASSNSLGSMRKPCQGRASKHCFLLGRSDRSWLNTFWYMFKCWIRPYYQVMESLSFIGSETRHAE